MVSVLAKGWPTVASPKICLSVVASIGGLALFLMLSSTVLVSKPFDNFNEFVDRGDSNLTSNELLSANSLGGYEPGSSRSYSSSAESGRDRSVDSGTNGHSRPFDDSNVSVDKSLSNITVNEAISANSLGGDDESGSSRSYSTQTKPSQENADSCTNSFAPLLVL